MPEVLHIATITGGLDLLLGVCTVWSDMTPTMIGGRGRVEQDIVKTPTQLQPNLNCSWRLDMKMTVHTPPHPHNEPEPLVTKTKHNMISNNN